MFIFSWGNKFVIVGNQNIRNAALFPDDYMTTKLPVTHYCLLEAIGRSRFSGQTSSGIWSLQYFMDPSLIFYVK